MDVPSRRTAAHNIIVEFECQAFSVNARPGTDDVPPHVEVLLLGYDEEGKPAESPSESPLSIDLDNWEGLREVIDDIVASLRKDIE